MIAVVNRLSGLLQPRGFASPLVNLFRSHVPTGKTHRRMAREYREYRCKALASSYWIGPEQPGEHECPMCGRKVVG